MSGFEPGGTVLGQTAGGHEEVGVGMVLQSSGPGVEDGEDAGRAAHPGTILGELKDRGGGFAEQRGVDEALVRSGERTELLGKREGEEVVVARQEPVAQLFEPPVGAVVLALGTVAVATGVVAVLEGTAVVAAIE